MNSKGTHTANRRTLAGSVVLYRTVLFVLLVLVLCGPALAALLLLQRGISPRPFLAALFGTVGLIIAGFGLVRPEVLATLREFVRPQEVGTRGPSQALVSVGLSYLVLGIGLWVNSALLIGLALLAGMAVARWVVRAGSR